MDFRPIDKIAWELNSMRSDRDNWKREALKARDKIGRLQTKILILKAKLNVKRT